MERILHEKKHYMDTDTDTISLSSTIPSPPRSTDFEFHTCSQQLAIDADELFREGKLLPLHLPPRSQQLLRDEPSVVGSAVASAAATPYELCNVSPAKPEDRRLDVQAKKSWTGKIKMIKQFVKSLFAKPARSEECSRAKHRRSFSGPIKRRPSNKSSSSASTSCSSSFSSASSSEAYVDAEAECSIQGAIAYCKKSQQDHVRARSVSGAEFYAVSVSRTDADCEDK